MSPRERSGEAGEPEQDAATLAALEREREQIEAGGIPMAAMKRLEQVRTPKGTGEGGGTFTSELSVAGFSLCHRLGLRPLAQVMGSSVYQVGYQGATWPMMMGGSVLTELNILTEAWNEVRSRALGRLAVEARQAGADAVVGVQLRTAYHEFTEGAIEYSVLGTAVAREGAPAAGEPVLTELSVSDYAKLLDAGVEPVGIVAWTSVFFAAFAYNMMLEPMRLNSAQNFELREFTAGVYGARERVMGRLGEQAVQRGASGIVGVRIGHTVRRQEVGSANRSRGGVVITFDAIGTAVRETAQTRPTVPQTNISLSS